MIQRLHRNARTSYIIRREIRESSESINKLAKRFGISWKTVKKWKSRSHFDDRSSKPKRLRTTLTRYEEDLIVFERKHFKKTIEEIFFSLEGRVKNLYPIKVYRVLRRHNLSILPRDLIETERKIKKFKKYAIGYLHIDTLYVPKIKKKRYYIFVAIDRVSKLAFVSISERKTRVKTSTFLRKVIKFYPYKINYILTDNGIEFSFNQITDKRRFPKDKIHLFDQVCRENKIEHRTIKFGHPWTNGMVERFNGKIKDKVIRRYLFENVGDLNTRLTEFINNYNFNIRLKQLSYKSPATHLKEMYNYSVQPIVI